MTMMRPAPFFFSLKWRAVALFSLLLLAINSFSVLYFSNSLSRQFELERKSSYGKRLKELDAMVRQSGEKLLTLSDIIPSLGGMEAALLRQCQKRRTSFCAALAIPAIGCIRRYG